MAENISLYIATVPSERQKTYQEMGFNVFFHYGTNTFTGKEWGDGKASPAIFNPKNQNTDQWIETAKAAGAKGVILTCKHHDGFCLWPTETTEYSVKNSPYKNGKGDVVREVSDSCRKYGLKFGIYLSPWDRNSEYYGTPQYNDFYIRQLTELLTNYGEIFCVWLDGACGSYMDGKEKQVYDFERIYATVRELQPNACISNCGPDIRWVGNEGGYARESEWNVVPDFQFDTQNIAAKSQQDENGQKMQSLDCQAEDLGSRKALEGHDHFIWYPSEVDVSIRPGWFYHKAQDHAIRSLKNLLHIYYTAVGGNSLLLLNVPPNKDGLLAKGDVKRMQEVGAALQNAFAKPVSVASVTADPAEDGFSPENCLKKDNTCYAPKAEAEQYNMELKFQAPAFIDKVVLKEQCDFSQRVEKFALYARLGDKEQKIYEGTVIGFKKIALFDAIKADGLRLKISECRSTPHLECLEVYEENGGVPKFSAFEQAVKRLNKNIRTFQTRIWEKQMEKKQEKQEQKAK